MRGLNPISIFVAFFGMQTVWAQHGMSPYMFERLSRGFALSSDHREVRPENFVIQLKSHSAGHILGSATRVCWSGSRGRTYFVSSYHVVRGADVVVNSESGQHLRTEFFDSLMDLVLLSSPQDSGPCLRLPSQFYAREVFDLEGAANGDLVDLQIEASVRGRLTQSRLKTVLVANRNFGLASYSATGPLLSIQAQGIPGMSGGAVMADMFEGRVVIPGYWQMDLATRITQVAERHLVGLITAIDGEGRQIAMLSGPVIKARMDLFGENPSRYGSRNEAVFRLRGSLSEGGTGRLFDGGSNGTGALHHSASGDRAWLSLGEMWTEYDAVSMEMRRALSDPRRLDGIYREGDQLFSTGPSTPFPRWLPLLEPRRIGDDWNLIAGEWAGALFRRQNPPPCVVNSAAVRKHAEETIYGGLVFVCERQNSNDERVLLIGAVSLRSQFEPVALRVSLVRGPCLGSGACSVQMRAQEESASDFPLRSKDQWLLWLTRRLEMAPSSNGMLTPEGLRTFRGNGRMQSVFVEGQGGYRIQIRGSWGRTFMVSGPVGEALGIVQPVLVSPQATRQMVLESFEGQNSTRRGRRR